MDYFQGVVAEYIRADRACFINPEFCLLNDLSDIKDHKKKYWFVDILAIQNEDRCAYLCEVTYAKPPSALIARLRVWHQHWPTIQKTLHRDAALPAGWRIRPWLFVPEDRIMALLPALPPFTLPPRITPLEMTVPWKYRWDRKNELEKPACIPKEMAV